jgi:hypothetical protein
MAYKTVTGDGSPSPNGTYAPIADYAGFSAWSDGTWYVYYSVTFGGYVLSDSLGWYTAALWVKGGATPDGSYTAIFGTGTPQVATLIRPVTTDKQSVYTPNVEAGGAYLGGPLSQFVPSGVAGSAYLGGGFASPIVDVPSDVIVSAVGATPVPDCTGTYVYDGPYNSSGNLNHSFKREDGAYYLYYQSGPDFWAIAATKGELQFLWHEGNTRGWMNQNMTPWPTSGFTGTLAVTPVTPSASRLVTEVTPVSPDCLGQYDIVPGYYSEGFEVWRRQDSAYELWSWTTGWAITPGAGIFAPYWISIDPIQHNLYPTDWDPSLVAYTIPGSGASGEPAVSTVPDELLVTNSVQSIYTPGAEAGQGVM